jgi:Zn-dependent M28 family amino/carboxypeptidase
MRTGSMDAAAAWVREAFARAGYEPQDQTCKIMGKEYANVEAVLPGAGQTDETVVVGAHYDSVPRSPGADDNASAVAGLLEIARLCRDGSFRRTLRFVAFANEEPPFFMTEEQGSRVYARRAKAAGMDVSAMVCLESIGYYSDAVGSQRYPFPAGLLYPKTGDFIAFVGNLASGGLVRRSVELFRRTTPMRCQGGAWPSLIPGVSWSDQRSFWIEGWPAVMVTDTALYRNPHYHTRLDTPDTLDYDRTARVVRGVHRLVLELAGER